MRMVTHGLSLSSVSCRTSNLARTKVPRSTSAGTALGKRVTSSRYAPPPGCLPCDVGTYPSIGSAKPTIFTNTKPDMKIVQEEIFGPVGVMIKFEDEEDVIHQANDTLYGLAAAVFSKDITRALDTAHRLKAGTAWVNCCNVLHANVPFGGFKQSGSTYRFLVRWSPLNFPRGYSRT